MSDRQLIDALHILIGRLHFMLAGVIPFNQYDMETADMVADWWNKRRA